MCAQPMTIRRDLSEGSVKGRIVFEPRDGVVTEASLQELHRVRMAFAEIGFLVWDEPTPEPER